MTQYYAYRNASQGGFEHGQAPRIGVLLANLGTPAAPTTSAVRRYLRQFLSDPRVVELPRPLWWLILNGIILNIRPKRSAAAYASVWTDAGSPLMVHASAQRTAVRQRYENDTAGPIIALGMTYGEPAIPTGLRELADQGVEKLLVIPLYPQYSGTTTGAVFDAVVNELKTWRWLPELHMLPGYHDHPHYIDALAASVRQHWQDHARGELLLMSFHGIPERYLKNGDPYHCQCHKTARLLAESLALTPDQWMVSFQSRVGREPWLKPYTDETMKSLPPKGVKRVDVICPGFSADCLETVEEINVENREYFMQAGGEVYNYVPCLNDNADHITMLQALVDDNIALWRQQLGRESAATYAASKERAIALGATR